MDTLHPQVPVLHFHCDEDIAELIQLLNQLDIQTIMSCQDNNGGRGTTRRVWVQINDYDLHTFLAMLDRPGEAGDPESLSNGIAAEGPASGLCGPGQALHARV
jgi:hypothetical protein